MTRYKWYLSQRGVPIVLLKGSKRTVSICYFGRHRHYRVFSPWGEREQFPPYAFVQQHRRDFTRIEDAFAHARGLCK